MKLPSYEQQNEFITKYIAPLFDLDFGKVMRNYRMNSAKPFTDERMQQIRQDILADAREKIEFNQKIDPLSTNKSDYTHSKNGEKTRKVDCWAYGGGLRLAPLKVEYVSKDLEASIDANARELLIQLNSFDNIERTFRPYRDLRPFNFLTQ